MKSRGRQWGGRVKWRPAIRGWKQDAAHGQWCGARSDVLAGLRAVPGPLDRWPAWVPAEPPRRIPTRARRGGMRRKTAAQEPETAARNPNRIQPAPPTTEWGPCSCLLGEVSDGLSLKASKLAVTGDRRWEDSFCSQRHPPGRLVWIRHAGKAAQHMNCSHVVAGIAGLVCEVVN